MASKTKSPDPAPAPGKFRVFYAEGYGTLEDMANVLTAIMPRPAQSTAATRLAQAPQQLLMGTGEPVVPDDEPLEETESELEVADVSVEQPSNGQKKRRGEGPKKDRNASIVAADVDWVPNDKDSLKAVIAAKKPSTDMERILVLGHYLERVLEKSNFGAGHILAGFGHIDASVPLDLKQTLRNMRTKNWLRFNNFDSIQLTTEGRNHVLHVLGKDGSK